MAKEDLSYRVENHIAHFTINREKQRNALNLATISPFLKHLDQAECDDTVKAVLITVIIMDAGTAADGTYMKWPMQARNSMPGRTITPVWRP